MAGTSLQTVTGRVVLNIVFTMFINIHLDHHVHSRLNSILYIIIHLSNILGFC
jgi:hypothetical protein